MDIIDAKKNIDIFKQNIANLDSYNHLYSSHAFKESCKAVRKDLVKRIQNIELQLKQNRG